MKPRRASIALGRGRGTAPFPGTPSPKTKPGRLHKRVDTPEYQEFQIQGRHPLTFRFTPTYSSWRNRVEVVVRERFNASSARGVFTSVADLARKLRKHICAYAKSPSHFAWTYTDPRRSIRTYEITGTAY